MSFDFTTYQAQALTTALPSALTMDYLAPGLIAELGEVCGKRAKAVRDGWDTDRLNREVCAELGDCLWFVALIAHVTGRGLGDWQIDSFTTADVQGGIRTALPMLSSRDAEPLILAYLLAVVAREAEAHGSTLDAVAQANLDKLADRQARGVLGGSGDAR